MQGQSNTCGPQSTIITESCSPPEPHEHCRQRQESWGQALQGCLCRENAHLRAQQAPAQLQNSQGCPIPVDSHWSSEHCNRCDHGFLVEPAKLALKSLTVLLCYLSFLFFILHHFQCSTKENGKLLFSTHRHHATLQPPTNTTLRSLLCHTSVSASWGRLQLEFKALHSEWDMLACHLQVNCRLLLRNPFNQSSS